ncbi:hypothetical protein VTO73DRAFT_12857 [Trametes versicolor]
MCAQMCARRASNPRKPHILAAAVAWYDGMFPAWRSQDVDINVMRLIKNRMSNLSVVLRHRSASVHSSPQVAGQPPSNSVTSSG